MPVVRRHYYHLAGRRIKGPRPNRLARQRAIEKWYASEVAQCAPDVLLGMEKLLPCDVFRAGGGVHLVWWRRCLENASPWRRWKLQRDPLHRHLLKVESQLFTVAGSRAVICNSSMVAAEVQKEYGYPAERIHVLHNGVNLHQFCPAEPQERARLRAELGILPEEKVLLFVGSGFWRKGLDHGLKIAAALRDQGLPFRYFVVGKGENRVMPRLARSLGLKDKVQFLGGQPPAEMVKWYQVADLFLFPSRYDPFANACLEAAACGVPVVTATGNGFREVIHDGETGLVIGSAETPGQTALRVCELLKKAPTAAAVRHTVEHLDLEAHVVKLVELLENIGPRPGGWGPGRITS